MTWFALLGLAACGRPSVPVEPAAGHAEKSPELLQGRLVHEPIERGVQSVQAYLGVEFFLEVDGGSTVDLRPTDAVPAEALAELAGANVEVTGELREGTRPPPDAAAPLEMDGEPMLQGGGFYVASVRRL